MSVWDTALATFLDFVPALVVVALVSGVLAVVDRLMFRRGSRGARNRLPRQLFMFVLTVVGLLLVLLALPMSDSTRGQVLGLVSLVVTAVVALSSTTFVANVMAGLMLRLVRSYEAGDFIRVGDHFGRVSDQGLFHTEIQTEDRDLTTFPNLHLATNPLTVVRGSGTIVSATVSLGYDVPHVRVETLLRQAVEEAGLEEPFVQVRELGDFSITYRAAGFLAEVKQLLTVRSNLRRSMLSALHRDGVEIVSPSFMNQRVLTPDTRFVPDVTREAPAGASADQSPEKVIFDKADDAARTAALSERHDELAARVEELSKAIDSADDPEKPRLEAELQSKTQRMERIEAELERQQEDVGER